MKKILVIDDDISSKSLIFSLLGKNKYKIIGAKNAGEGYRLSTQFLPDLVICGHSLFSARGSDILGEFSQSVELSKIPFLIILPLVKKEADLSLSKYTNRISFIHQNFTGKELNNAVDTICSPKNKLQQGPVGLFGRKKPKTREFNHEILSSARNLLDHMNESDYEEIRNQVKDILNSMNHIGQKSGNH